jgi:hypothetical protein
VKQWAIDSPGSTETPWLGEIDGKQVKWVFKTHRWVGQWTLIDFPQKAAVEEFAGLLIYWLQPCSNGF